MRVFPDDGNNKYRGWRRFQLVTFHTILPSADVEAPTVVVVANLHVTDGAGSHAVPGNAKQRVKFKKAAIENVTKQLLAARSSCTQPEVQGWLAGDFNLPEGPIVDATVAGSVAAFKELPDCDDDEFCVLVSEAKGGGRDTVASTVRIGSSLTVDEAPVARDGMHAALAAREESKPPRRKKEEKRRREAPQAHRLFYEPHR